MANSDIEQLLNRLYANHFPDRKQNGINDVIAELNAIGVIKNYERDMLTLLYSQKQDVRGELANYLYKMLEETGSVRKRNAFEEVRLY